MESISSLFLPCFQLEQSSQKPDDESVVSRRLQELSHEEREQALYDLHGVSAVVEETPELVAQKTNELDLELGKIANASAFMLAKKQDLKYVEKHRIMFLRADQFDCKRAAERMVRFFELKRQTFGDAKLTQDITLRDLSQADKECLKDGSMQILPQKDRGGRVVMFRFGAKSSYADLDTVLRLICFQVMNTIEDEEVQKRGMVFVQYSVGQKQIFNDRAFPLVSTLTSLPIRLAGSHFCYDNPVHHHMAKLIRFLFDSIDVCRFRAHFGSHMEARYALMTFGIDKNMIPVDSTGTMQITFHNQWIQSIEEQAQRTDDLSVKSNDAKIVVPGQFDVLMGRGRHGECSQGNVRFKHLLEENKDRYNAAKRFGKAEVIKDVLKELQDGGSRFIKREVQGWVQISDDAAKDKISHAFRNLRTTVVSSNASKAQSVKRGRHSSSPSPAIADPASSMGSKFIRF